MEYTKTTDDLHVQKRVILNGPQNYNEWLCAINNKLIPKDVFGVASGIEPYPVLNSTNTVETQQTWIRNDQLAWSIIDEALDLSGRQSTSQSCPGGQQDQARFEVVG